jgi:long-chain acyl-CoA synthetase
VRTERASLTDMVWANAERFGDTVSLRRRAADAWQDVTAREFAGQVLSVAKGLIAAGLRPGDRVGLLSATGYEWPLADFAVWTAGCVTVPIGDGSGPDELARILADSNARAVVVATEAQRAAVREVAGGIDVWQLAGELTELGAEIDDRRMDDRRLAVGPDDPATLRDADELTHGAVLTEVRSTIAGYPALLGPGSSMLIHLPLTSWFARVMSLCCVYTRTAVGYSARVGDVGTFRPTTVVTEPRLLEQVYAAAELRAHAEDRGRLFRVAADVAVDYSTAIARGGPSVGLRGKHLMASRFLYPKLRVALGGRCTAVISVGGPVDERLGHFFHGLGIPVHSA